jgi:hypothetical protein
MTFILAMGLKFGLSYLFSDITKDLGGYSDIFCIISSFGLTGIIKEVFSDNGVLTVDTKSGSNIPFSSNIKAVSNNGVITMDTGGGSNTPSSSNAPSSNVPTASSDHTTIPMVLKPLGNVEGNNYSNYPNFYDLTIPADYISQINRKDIINDIKNKINSNPNKSLTDIIKSVTQIQVFKDHLSLTDPELLKIMTNNENKFILPVNGHARLMQSLNNRSVFFDERSIAYNKYEDFQNNKRIVIIPAADIKGNELMGISNIFHIARYNKSELDRLMTQRQVLITMDALKYGKSYYYELI